MFSNFRHHAIMLSVSVISMCFGHNAHPWVEGWERDPPDRGGKLPLERLRLKSCGSEREGKDMGGVGRAMYASTMAAPWLLSLTTFLCRTRIAQSQCLVTASGGGESL